MKDNQKIELEKLKMNRIVSAFICAVMLLLAGCISSPKPQSPESGRKEGKIRKLYTFFTPKTEEDIALMKKYNVVATSTDANPKTIELLHKAGIQAYASFGPVGWHDSQLTPEQKAVQAYLNGSDLPKDAERPLKIARRLKNGRYSYGGEPFPDVKFCGGTEVFWEGYIRCFVGEKAREMARAQLDRVCAVPGIDGIAFDYVGYTNYHGCEHPECRRLCVAYLKENNLPDTQENRNKFFLNELVEYYASCARHIRSIHPEFKIMAHLYPVFLPEPLYGNRLDIDIAGETCAWYRIWNTAKVEDYARRAVLNQHKYHKNTTCVPFIAITAGDWADIKTPEIVDAELRAILKSGTDTLMMHEFRSFIRRPEIMAVFDKYVEQK